MLKIRGNVALPVDIVKVLKHQDENYIRTMRTAGSRLGMNKYQNYLHPHNRYTRKLTKIKYN